MISNEVFVIAIMDFVRDIKEWGQKKIFFMAIEALSEPSGDLISRADAIEALGEEPEIILDTNAEWEMHDRWVDAMTSMKSLPSAESNTGEWILVCDSEGEGDNLYRCSECGCEYGCQEYDKPNFCLDCGAKMFEKDGEFK